MQIPLISYARLLGYPVDERETATPLYSALCEGLITSQSAATAWKLLCDQIGIDCQIVEGSRDEGRAR